MRRHSSNSFHCRVPRADAMTSLNEVIRQCSRVSDIGIHADPGQLLNPATKARAAAQESMKSLGLNRTTKARRLADRSDRSPCATSCLASIRFATTIMNHVGWYHEESGDERAFSPSCFRLTGYGKISYIYSFPDQPRQHVLDRAHQRGSCSHLSLVRPVDKGREQRARNQGLSLITRRQSHEECVISQYLAWQPSRLSRRLSPRSQAERLPAR